MKGTSAFCVHVSMGCCVLNAYGVASWDLTPPLHVTLGDNPQRLFGKPPGIFSSHVAGTAHSDLTIPAQYAASAVQMTPIEASITVRHLVPPLGQLMARYTPSKNACATALICKLKPAQCMEQIGLNVMPAVRMPITSQYLGTASFNLSARTSQLVACSANGTYLLHGCAVLKGDAATLQLL